MSLREIVNSVYRRLGPDVIVEEDRKVVVIREKYFFSRLTEAYYNLKGYRVKREG